MSHHYAELGTTGLAEAIARNPLFISPWGALEWHGPHLPLGLDGLVAEEFCRRLAAETDGILLPGTWLPITTLPHPHSISIPTATVCAVWRSLLDELVRVGARKICLVTGHYAQGHVLEIYREAKEAMMRHEGVIVIAASPLELLFDDDLLDHAARRETAQLLAFRPELVHLEEFADGPPAANAVLGDDPRLATAEEGERLLADGVAAWKNALELWTAPVVYSFYQRREKAYRPYRTEFFKESWEQAIADWWKARSSHG